MSGRKQTPNVLDALMGGTPPKPAASAFDLIVPEDFDYDEWQDFGHRINEARKQIRFIIGDWIVAGDRKWGDIYTDAERITGKNNQYLRECVMVSTSFNLLSRDNKLSWSHHKALCSVPEDQRPAFIETVKASGLSVAETRKLINPPPGQAYTGTDRSNPAPLTGEFLPPEPDAAGQHTPRGTCKICHRPLTSADSVAAGMGDVCAAHAARDAGIGEARADAQRDWSGDMWADLWDMLESAYVHTDIDTIWHNEASTIHERFIDLVAAYAPDRVDEFQKLIEGEAAQL